MAPPTRLHSRLIKGGWQLAGGHGDIDHAAALRDMRAFVDAGIHTFDCADIYTGVEELIGAFLRTMPPGAVRIHTKCVPDLDRLARLQASDIATTVERSRERLGVSSIDLVQFHWWDYQLGDFVGAAHHLVALRDAGVVTNIGVTNFNVQGLTALLDSQVPVVAHQVQYSLLDRRPAADMAPLCAARDVRLLCYGALAGGFFHERWLGRPEPVEPQENRSLAKYKLIIDECGGWTRFQALLRLLASIGAKHGVGIGAVAIRWVLDQPGVTAAIVGARSAAHLPGTLDATRVTLGPEDVERLAAFLADTPIPPGDVYDLERDRDGRHGRIMRYNLSRRAT